MMSGLTSRPSTKMTNRSRNILASSRSRASRSAGGKSPASLFPSNDSRRSSSQFGSFVTSSTNDPSGAKLIDTCVRSSSWPRSCAPATHIAAATAMWRTRRRSRSLSEGTNSGCRFSSARQVYRSTRPGTRACYHRRVCHRGLCRGEAI